MQDNSMRDSDPNPLLVSLQIKNENKTWSIT